MEDRHREHIRKSIKDLIRTTKYTPLMDACEQRNLLSKTMRARIDGLPDADEYEKHKQLFEKITRRGPNAYDELIKIVIQLKYSLAATILHAPRTEDTQYISIRNPDAIKNKPIEPVINDNFHLPDECYPSRNEVDSKATLVPLLEKVKPPGCLEVIKSTKLHYDGKVPFYPMKSRKRGVFFLVNIIDFPKSNQKKRSGSELDVQSLLYLFQEFGFICFPYENLTATEFYEVFEKLRSSDYLKETESFVMALMSHGEMTKDMHDHVEFFDGSIIKVQEIEDLLSNSECPNLSSKPKVLIFPFCRGVAPDSGVSRLENDSISSAAPCLVDKTATRSDIMVCYASVRGFQALRDPDIGSWYIQAFYKTLAALAHTHSLEDMLKLIGNEIEKLRSTEGYMQTSAYYSHGFNKALYFNPGVYEE